MSILDMKAESNDEKLWCVTNEDGSVEIVDEKSRAGRGGFAPAWGRPYREVLADFVRHFERREANWVKLYAALRKGIHDVPGVFSGKTKGAYIVAGGEAYKAIYGTHHKGDFLGFGGQKYRIAMYAGETFESNNVWHLCRVPPHLRDLLPDNATMEAL